MVRVRLMLTLAPKLQLYSISLIRMLGLIRTFMIRVRVRVRVRGSR